MRCPVSTGDLRHASVPSCGKLKRTAHGYTSYRAPMAFPVHVYASRYRAAVCGQMQPLQVKGDVGATPCSFCFGPFRSRDVPVQYELASERYNEPSRGLDEATSEPASKRPQPSTLGKVTPDVILHGDCHKVLARMMWDCVPRARFIWWTLARRLPLPFDLRRSIGVWLTMIRVSHIDLLRLLASGEAN